MKRLVAVLLIPMFMLGQPVPHSHAGVEVDRPDDHAARPHVHLSMHHHDHGHSHHHSDTAVDHDHGNLGKSDAGATDPVAVIDGLTAHDDDAFYVANVTLSHLRQSGGEQQNSRTVVDCDLPVRSVGRPLSEQLCRGPSRLGSSPPIYILTASLRL